MADWYDSETSLIFLPKLKRAAFYLPPSILKDQAARSLAFQRTKALPQLFSFVTLVHIMQPWWYYIRWEILSYALKKWCLSFTTMRFGFGTVSYAITFLCILMLFRCCLLCPYMCIHSSFSCCATVQTKNLSRKMTRFFFLLVLECTHWSTRPEPKLSPWLLIRDSKQRQSENKGNQRDVKNYQLA